VRRSNGGNRRFARIRNAGAAAARGEILVTIDADSRMSANMLVHVVRLLETGKFIGGGTLIIPERWSLGICCSLLPLVPYALWYRVSAGLFWCYKKDFDAIGGFDEDFISVEDVDFAERLRAYGRRVGKRYGTIWRGWITTSCRKFDHFGDWYFFRNPSVVRRLFTGRDRAAADRFYYEVGRHEGEEKA
jgi:GT2 family glycosyltransferase